ncbi:MAG: hypothetical protein R6X02_13415 [Enhygromyxa sp.]
MTDGIKNLKKALSKRPDVYADFERIGRPIKDASRIEEAVNETGVPAALAELYAGCNGLHVAWCFVGYDADEGDPRGLLGGKARLLELDKLCWQELGEHRVMRLDNEWNNHGLLVLRSPGRDDRVIYAKHELRGEDDFGAVIELGSPQEFFPRWVELGFPLPMIWSTPLLEQQAARLAKAPTKRKVELGARVWPHKAKSHDTSHTMRGQVRAIEAGSNGKRYAEVEWDDATVSWIRVNLLAALGRDRYELAASEPIPADGLSSLLAWLSSNEGVQCFVVSEADAHEHRVAKESYWLARALAGTPLEQLIDATAAWVEAREIPSPADYEREKAEGIYVPGPEEAVEASTMRFADFAPAESVSLRRAARALTDAVVIRWLRERDEAAPAALIALDERVGSPYRDEDETRRLGEHLATPGKRRVVARLDDDSELSSGQALGLSGPVRYTHD